MLVSSALIALVATSGIAGQPALAVVGAPAASRLPATILTAVAGSAKYLAYTRLTRPAAGGPRTGGLFVLAKGKSKPRRVASISGGTDGPYFMAGSMLVYGSVEQVNTHPGLTYNVFTNWFNLANGESGRLQEPSDRTFTVAAAPDGWITVDNTDGTLVDQATDGTSRPLGQPVPQSTEPFVSGGSNELVVYSVFSDDSDGNGELRVMSFDKPGVFRTLIPSLKDATEEDYRCPTVAAHYTACVTEAARVRLVPLDGSPQIKTTKGCTKNAYPKVLHHSAAWNGCGGKLTVLSPDGKIHVSAHRYNLMVPAFGELAATDLAQQKLLLISSASSTPKVLVSA